MTRTALSRPAGFVGLAGVIVGLVLPATGLGLSTCGMLRMFGLPCPGCGLTRSVSCFLQGKIVWSFLYHPLGWVFAVTFVFLGVTSLLPTAPRQRLIARLSKHDNLFGAAFLGFCILLLLYGVLRAGLVVANSPDYTWWRTTQGERPPFIERKLFPPANTRGSPFGPAGS